MFNFSVRSFVLALFSENSPSREMKQYPQSSLLATSSSSLQQSPFDKNASISLLLHPNYSNSDSILFKFICLSLPNKHQLAKYITTEKPAQNIRNFKTFQMEKLKRYLRTKKPDWSIYDRIHPYMVKTTLHFPEVPIVHYISDNTKYTFDPQAIPLFIT